MLQPPPDIGSAKTVLLAALALFAAVYTGFFVRGMRRARDAGSHTVTTPTGGGVLTGFITNFFDTLGIGSFASTTSIFRFWNMVPDERIPGTLNVGHTLPAIVQAFIFTRIVPVESRTLILMIAAAIAGAWLGAGVVASWPRRNIQLGMGLALAGAAALMLLSLFHLTPGGGDALALTGGRLALAVGVNFVLGALMTLGIGLYAPCMILISALGMNPVAAFPIMMGSCAFLMPVASIRFIRFRSFDPRAAVGLLIGGLPAVLIAAFLVKSLPLTAVRWLVVVVVIYTSVTLLRAAAASAARARLLPHEPHRSRAGPGE